jgi:hypothetical protein
MGDHLKKIILIIAALCCAAISCDVLAQEKAASKLTNLTSDSGINIEKMNLTLHNNTFLFGQFGLTTAEAVKFNAPRPGWMLKGIQILGWDGFKGTVPTVPRARLICIEVRDKDRNLLYRFADTQVPYFNFALNITNPIVAEIDLPPIPVSGEFYIMFYDRGAVDVGAELENSTGNSYFFNMRTLELQPAKLPWAPNQTIPVNWIIRAIGE